MACPTNHHLQNAEHPNYVSSGWSVLHYVLNSGGLDYLGIFQAFRGGPKGWMVFGNNWGMVLIQEWVAVLM
jgi:hypothetical protein